MRPVQMIEDNRGAASMELVKPRRVNTVPKTRVCTAFDFPFGIDQADIGVANSLCGNDSINIVQAKETAVIVWPAARHKQRFGLEIPFEKSCRGYRGEEFLEGQPSLSLSPH